MNKIRTIADMTFIPIFIYDAKGPKEHFHSSLLYEHFEYSLEKFRDSKILDGNYIFKFSTINNQQWPGYEIYKEIILNSTNFTVTDLLYELCKILCNILRKNHSYDMNIVKFDRVNNFEYYIMLDY